MKTKTIHCSVQFVTPAFVGGANQAAQWRTPPFKALLRRWWRVVWVVRAGTSQRPDVNKLRQAEAELFGTAADKSDPAGSRASRVKLRLDWRGVEELRPEQWRVRTGKVKHLEVERAGYQVDAALYLGYGPLDFDKQKGHRLNRPSALPAGNKRELTVRVPPEEADSIKTALCLAHSFGGLGSRNRNGWGSLHFEQGGLNPEELKGFLEPDNREAREWLRAFSRAWQEALDSDWCHAVGRDDRGLLIWRTDAMDRWEDVMARLAEVKIAFRTQFRSSEPGTPSGLKKRHLLAYPITRHAYHAIPHEHAWNRSANQVVFKVLALPGGAYVGLAAHLPHALPQRLLNGVPESERDQVRDMELQVWPRVHEKLDETLTRLP